MGVKTDPSGLVPGWRTETIRAIVRRENPEANRVWFGDKRFPHELALRWAAKYGPGWYDMYTKARAVVRRAARA